MTNILIIVIISHNPNYGSIRKVSGTVCKILVSCKYSLPATSDREFLQFAVEMLVNSADRSTIGATILTLKNCKLDTIVHPVLGGEGDKIFV